MTQYKITMTNRWGELFVEKVTASSLYEAMKKVEIESGWTFSEYSVIGFC